MDIFLLLALILLNGVFAMSELALVTARKARLSSQAEAGDKAAITAIQLGEDPTRFLSTIQIGITSIGILNGIVGQAALAGPLSAWLQSFGVEPRTGDFAGTAIAVVLITYVSIVIGELVPKRIGQLRPEVIARLVARPMHWLSVIAHPFVRLLSGSTAFMLRVLGQRDTRAPAVTEEEIRAILQEGSEAGIIEKTEHVMVRNVFRLDERQAVSLMVPRADVVLLDANRPIEENLAIMADSDHSRFPVCRGGLDEILGVVNSRHVFKQIVAGAPADLTRHLQPAVYVPESLSGMELLEQFRASGVPMVFVTDEYGDVLGVVSVGDVLEAVTGEFRHDGEEEASVVQREDGSWLLDGLLSVPELMDRLELKTVPDGEKRRYHTLSGMVMTIMGRLPKTGDVTEWEGWRLEVVDLDGKRIDKVLASRLPATGSTVADG